MNLRYASMTTDELELELRRVRLVGFARDVAFALAGFGIGAGVALVLLR